MKRALLVCLTALFVLLGATVLADVSVTLPAGYDGGGAHYPVVYLLPEDGYAADVSGVAQLIGAEVILVQPVFEAGGDPLAVLKAAIAETDAAYRTMPEENYRALLGAGVGGYLSYALGLEMIDEIGAMVSIRGNFAGEDNPWLAVCGDVQHKIDQLHAQNPQALESVYTYMDAPVEDAYSNQPGGTNELGAMFIGFGTGSACHEYTVRPGAFDAAFLAESVSRAMDRIDKWMFPPAEETAPAIDPLSVAEAAAIDGDMQKIELNGAWHFRYVGQEMLDAAALDAAEFGAWPVVLPGSGNWTKGYGNISDENVTSGYGPDYFDYFITGSGYYARTFSVPEAFDAEEIVLSIGYVDDRCEVYLNGVRVGATGMDESGQPTGETTWAVFSHFDVDPAIVNRGGENVVIVRAYNDLPFGAGGWYGGPTALYSRAAFDAENGATGEERFAEETFPSKYAAKALDQNAPYENPYLIYLPEGYEESDRRYPTVYLLHQFNSDHTSYRIDKVDQLFDEGVAEGLFDEMIVVVPASSEESWWAGDWEKMITEELIPHIDAKYRTVRDARFRLTAGCSMGGQGAMGVALRNPDDFSGAVSFFGAFSYGGASSPNAIAQQETAEYMDAFSLYFICGNQDSYGFGVPNIALHQQLENMGVGHRFFIDNGGHDSGFYLPRFKDAFAYVRGDMYKADDGLDSCLRGGLSCEGEKRTITASLETLEGIEAYLYQIPDSSYTKNANPALVVTLTLTFSQDGGTVTKNVTAYDDIAGAAKKEVSLDAADYVDIQKPFEVTLTASALGREVELAELKINGK